MNMLYTKLILFFVLSFIGINSNSQSLLDQLIETKKNVIFDKTVYFPDSITYKPIEYKVFKVDSLIINGPEKSGHTLFYQLDSSNIKHGWCLMYKKGEYCIVGKYFNGKQHDTWYYYSYKSKKVILKTSVTFEYGKKLSVGYFKKKIRRKKSKTKNSSLPSIVDMF